MIRLRELCQDGHGEAILLSETASRQSLSGAESAGSSTGSLARTAHSTSNPAHWPETAFGEIGATGPADGHGPEGDYWGP
jgi:hypothetical protein